MHWNKLSTSDFRQISRNSEAIYCKSLVILVQKKARELQKPSFGITITKRIGKANVRNLIRRRLKSIFIDLTKKYDLEYQSIVFIARNSITEKSYLELNQQIEQKLKKYFKQI